MDTKRRFLIASLVAALCCASQGLTPVRAEVAAEVDAFGDYVRTVVFSNASVNNPKIWTAKSQRKGYVALNVGGDANGDLFPLIVEDPLNANHPWVVWSRFNGQDYDLAWSRWSETWEPILSVGGTAVGDDLDPAMILNQGRPYLAWWRNEQGIGRVYMSVFLSTRWADPLLLSDPAVDSRYPSVELRDGRVVVRFDTAQGAVETTLGLDDTDSINDDINPFESFTPPEPVRPSGTSGDSN